MMPVGPQPTGIAQKLAEVGAPVSPTTDEITSLRRRVENISAQLGDVLNRLEV
jgi:hypothetical protein